MGWPGKNASLFKSIASASLSYLRILVLFFFSFNLRFIKSTDASTNGMKF